MGYYLPQLLSDINNNSDKSSKSMWPLNISELLKKLTRKGVNLSRLYIGCLNLKIRLSLFSLSTADDLPDISGGMPFFTILRI